MQKYISNNSNSYSQKPLHFLQVSEFGKVPLVILSAENIFTIVTGLWKILFSFSTLCLFFKLIELGIEKLEPTQKIEISEDGTKYIIEKSMEEKLRENLITQEEYDNYIIQIRQMQYQTNLDGARAELLDSVLSNLSNQGLLTEEQKTQLDMLNNKRIEIKESNPKSDILLNA